MAALVVAVILQGLGIALMVILGSALYGGWAPALGLSSFLLLTVGPAMLCLSYYVFGLQSHFNA